MDLTDLGTIEKLFNETGFSFKKSLGQNFIVDPEICPAMAKSACDMQTGIIEIGPGIGVLTKELAKTAQRIVAIELDERLKPILSKTLADFDNVKVIFGDAMKLDLVSLIHNELSGCKRVSVCANLPYYITSPIIMSLLCSKLPIDEITVMVQKEAADRICATVGSRAAGAVTVAVNYYAEANLLFDVPKTSFIPVPKVNSAVISLKIRDNPPVNVGDEDFFFKFVKSCFAQRRKTLINSVSNTLNIDKSVLRLALEKENLDENVRSEALSMEKLAALSVQLLNLK